ncbi:WD40 repeat domain-containing protein [Microcystis sp. M061S2]|uniref:WD40 repeat domain-containing protein n=1 Tax=Microcystis sp. M061S2 TaxID=2771171 RepID=UPI00258842EA|nr:WD40 repeat domain-containing protein [Microcystis sp. M061S2]MCA2656075.1 WD40 repeat domain-containing protein [Microcystis sp. M061S2]
MDKKERQLYLATVPSSAFESGNLKRYYGCLTCYPFISDKLNHPSFDVQDVINDYDYVHQSDLREYPNYDAERTEALKLIQETFRLSAHILREHPEQLISQLLGRLFYPSLLENSYIQSFLEQAKAKIVPPALIPYLGSLQPPCTSLIRTLTHHGGNSSFWGKISSLAITSDGTKIISTQDWIIKVWDLATGKKLYDLYNFSEDQILQWTNLDEVSLVALAIRQSVTSLVITPDSNEIIFGDRNNTINVWNLATGKKIRTLSSHQFAITSLAITHNGNKIISSSEDNTIKVWDLATGQELLSISTHQNRISSLVVTPDGTKIVSGSNDGTIKIWDLYTGQELLILIDHYTLAITPDSTKIISSQNGIVKVLDLATGKKIRTLTLSSHYNSISSSAITPDNTKIIFGYSDGMIKIWDLCTEQELLTLIGHHGKVSSLIISHDGSKIVSGSYDKTIKIWNLAIEKRMLTPIDYSIGDKIYSLAITPDDNIVILGFWNYIKVCNLATRKEIKLYNVSGIPKILAITPDGTKFILALGWWIKVCNITSGKAIRTLPNCAYFIKYLIANFRENLVNLMFYSINTVTASDGTKVAISRDKTIKVWDLGTGKELLTLSGHQNPINSLVISLDGTKIISGCQEGIIKVWDLSTGKELLTLNSRQQGIDLLAITSDCKKIVFIATFRTIKVWDLDTAKELLTFNSHHSTISSLTITPNNQYVISSGLDSSGLDTTIKIWDLDTGECLTSLVNDCPIICCAIYPDSKKLIAGDEAGRLHFLELIV